MAAKLAIEGGPKTVTNKLAGWPQFDEKAIRAVEQVLYPTAMNERWYVIRINWLRVIGGR